MRRGRFDFERATIWACIIFFLVIMFFAALWLKAIHNELREINDNLVLLRTT